MRILTFTLFLSLFAFVLNAQEWNISADNFNALGSIQADTTVEGLTIYASAEKSVVVDANDKTAGDMSFTHRLKLGGSGTVTDSVAPERVVAFDVEGDVTITVAAMSSSAGEDRNLVMTTLAGDTLGVYLALGSELTMTEFEYTGEATTIFIFSENKGINIYYLKSEAIEDIIPPIFVSTDEYAIFDPATVDPSTLADGMTIIEVNGKKLLQVIVNDWNSIINVPEFAFEPGMTAFAEFKYVLGQDEFAVDKINAVVQLIDTINKMTVDWEPLPVPTTTGLIQGNPSGDFKMVSAAPAGTTKFTHQVQFFGQDNVGYGAIIGDTLWVGKVRAYKVDKSAIFDPVTYDPDNLAEGMEVVEVNGEKYLQVVVNEWNSIVSVPEFTFKDGVKAFAEFKYSIGQEEFAADKINAVVQLIDTINKMTVSWEPLPVPTTTGLIQGNPSGEFKMVSAAPAGTTKFTHQVQFFGQETVDYGAVTGDTLWVGKVRAYEVDPLVIVDPATIDPASLNTGWEIVDISGTKYFKVTLAGWDSWINIPEYTFPKETIGFKCQVKYEAGTSGFEVDKVNTFLQLSTSGWEKIESLGSGSSAEFKEYNVSLPNISNKAGLFQVAGQETTDYNAIAGGILYISKVEVVKAPTTAPVTFIIDDSAGKTYEGFMLKGSWNTATGEYDSEWNDGAEQAAFYDDGTNGDAVAGDHIWSVTLNLVSDDGVNTWEWGFNDLSNNWIPDGNTQFKVADTKKVTTTYSIKVGVNDYMNQSVKLYPNPTNGMIYISGVDAKKAEIYNLSGAKVQTIQLSSNSINVSNLSQGSYLMKVTDANGATSISKFNKK
ncbi:MAG TPA: T9SS type A sorting domain-containing protein [Prolixibacteraceae bacterium]|nr:T9SS type A sorting domain-containing protein [Prolixibacteraceae bacterium]